MRILSLRFENVNNLKGRQYISFESEPLRSAGIFAIVGPTGSGKSTILDVVTLALFNRIPRFKGGISSTKIIDLGSIVTHHTSNAFAEIIYEINNRKYLSKWSIEKNRNGKFRDYEMSIQLESGEYLDLKRSEVPGKNEEIIGLNYDQFIKSIILSQGQFSRFLKSDKNERGQLLENLTGTSIYRKIGQKAYFKFVETKRQLDDIAIGLKEIKVLHAEERSNIEAEIIRHKRELTKIEKQISLISKGRQVKIEIQETKAKIDTSRNEQVLIQKRKEGFQRQFEKLERHDQISTFRAELSNYKIAQNTISSCEKDVKEYLARSIIAEDRLTRVIDEMSELTQKKVNANNFKIIMSGFEKEVNTLDNELVHLKHNGQKIRARLNGKLAKYPSRFKDKTQPNEISVHLKKQLKALRVSIQNSDISEHADVQEQRAIVGAQKENLTLLKYVHDKSKALEKLQIDTQKALAQIVQFEKIIEEDLTKSENLLSKQVLQKELLESLLIQKENAIKIASLEKHRDHLQDGMPCPLCGAVHHPFLEHKPNLISSELDKKIVDTKRDIQESETILKQVDQQLTKNRTNKISQEQLIAQWKTSQADLDNEISSLRKNKDISTFDLDRVQEEIDNLGRRIEEKEVAIQALETLRVNLEVQEICNELEDVIAAFKQVEKNRQAKFTGSDVSSICNDLQDQFNKNTTIIATAKEAISLKQKEQESAIRMLTEIEEVLKPQMQAFGFESISKMSENLMEESVFIRLKKEKENLVKEETAINALLKSLYSQLESKAREDNFQDVSLEELVRKLNASEETRDNLNKQIGERTSILDRDNQDIERRKSKEASQEVVQKELEKWALINNMIGDSKGNKFANFAQGLTLKNLIVLTNKRLKHLSERYILDKPASDGELRVIDQYQGNTERAISTLSGGETFIISLALALSLSDMASRNVSLDSLFIDEGFGTLDQETLEIAMDTLERLQTESQKMVGVISHVAALKERINVQIKLQKNAQGFSKLIVES